MVALLGATTAKMSLHVQVCLCRKKFKLLCTQIDHAGKLPYQTLYHRKIYPVTGIDEGTCDWRKAAVSCK